MKSHKRRSRIVAGFALLAASAAVASALAAPVSAIAAPNVPIVTSADALGHVAVGLPAAEAARPRGPRRLGEGKPPKRSQVIAVAAESASGSAPVAPAAAAQSSAPLVSADAVAWPLEYAGAASRTRGQPRTDALT